MIEGGLPGEREGARNALDLPVGALRMQLADPVVRATRRGPLWSVQPAGGRYGDAVEFALDDDVRVIADRPSRVHVSVLLPEGSKPDRDLVQLADVVTKPGELADLPEVIDLSDLHRLVLRAQDGAGKPIAAFTARPPEASSVHEDSEGGAVRLLSREDRFELLIYAAGTCIEHVVVGSGARTVTLWPSLRANLRLLGSEVAPEPYRLMAVLRYMGEVPGRDDAIRRIHEREHRVLPFGRSRECPLALGNEGPWEACVGTVGDPLWGGRSPFPIPCVSWCLGRMCRRSSTCASIPPDWPRRSHRERADMGAVLVARGRGHASGNAPQLVNWSPSHAIPRDPICPYCPCLPGHGHVSARRDPRPVSLPGMVANADLIAEGRVIAINHRNSDVIDPGDAAMPHTFVTYVHGRTRLFDADGDRLTNLEGIDPVYPGWQVRHAQRAGHRAESV